MSSNLTARCGFVRLPCPYSLNSYRIALSSFPQLPVLTYSGEGTDWCCVKSRVGTRLHKRRGGVGAMKSISSAKISVVECGEGRLLQKFWQSSVKTDGHERLRSFEDVAFTVQHQHGDLGASASRASPAQSLGVSRRSLWPGVGSTKWSEAKEARDMRGCGWCKPEHL